MKFSSLAITGSTVLFLSTSPNDVSALSIGPLRRIRNKFRFGRTSMPPVVANTLGEAPKAAAATEVATTPNGPTPTNPITPIPPTTPTTPTQPRYYDKDLNHIFHQNHLWVESKKAADPLFFDKLGSIHRPDYMWIGCADARVPANEIMGEDAGQVFCVRNVANLVVATDFNLMSALQYAVDVLKVPHIVVCGHYDCGGIRASTQVKDHVPPLENWLRNIRDVYRLHRVELDLIKDPEEKHRRLVELNTIEQCINLFKTGAIQRRRLETFRKGCRLTTPRIHACVYDPATGYMKRLEVDFKEYIDELHDIYDLYELDSGTDSDSISTIRPHAPNIPAPVGQQSRTNGID